MSTRIGLIVSNTSNPWFKVMIDDGNGCQREVASGPDLGRALNYAAVMLGYPLVLPISGPDTSL